MKINIFRRRAESLGERLARFERSKLVWTVEYEAATDRYAINCLNPLTGTSRWRIAPGYCWFTPGFLEYQLKDLQSEVCRSWWHY